MRTISVICDELYDKKNKISALAEKIEKLEAETKVLEAELIEEAKKQGTEIGNGKKAKFELRTVTVPQVADWDKLYAYILKQKYTHLLQRRPAVKACQELWERGVRIPGVEKFSSTKIAIKGKD